MPSFLACTRVDERVLIRSAGQLRFLVLDELHTYRGRQGADVGMLVRRCRDAFSGNRMICVGTSATMASEGSAAEQAEAVAAVGSKLFGTEILPDQIIGESLRRPTQHFNFADSAVLASLKASINESPPKTTDEFAINPLASWLESFFGLQVDEQSGELVRRAPQPVGGPEGAVATLFQLTGMDEETCEKAIRSYLLAGSVLVTPTTGFPIFAFRLHQFISRGDTVWASLETPDQRHFEFRKQITVPGDESRRLFPLVFCRECGCAYYRVDRIRDGDGSDRFLPREMFEVTDVAESGYLYVSPNAPWPENAEEIIERVPDDWKEVAADGGERISKRAPLPENLHVTPDGAVSQDGGMPATFMPAPFRMCLSPDCGVAYNARQRADRLKLNTLGIDTRSTATTILALRAVTVLQQDMDLPEKARKLLSFTDNRQDASLQAGHFNDFALIGLIRSALYKALSSAPEGLRHDDLPVHVFNALDLPLDQYASDPETRPPARMPSCRPDGW